ncbi:hypothetical protein ACJH6J_24705 [Mycobacterium sp. SMC-18]|uniref:hypothetical protein n=1 Tax=unclassified Mycobacterium TaxID=2642494 RepID=UPI00093BC815|nr:hypothetical protein [Mycobacterium sp. ST-F2]OKH78290.1 hypothetical protein EB75_28085 [Mycobacterium sp. ST-F2]
MARIDHETVERSERERAANAAEERRKYLYARLFQHVTPTRDVAGLRTESQASDMFLRARGENLLQIAILRVAVDNRWGSVVTAFIKLWDGEHPIAGTVQELWNLTLTTGRSAV